MGACSTSRKRNFAEPRQSVRNLASLPSAFAAVYTAQGRKEMVPIAALERVIAQDGPAARDALLWRALLLLVSG